MSKATEWERFFELCDLAMCSPDYTITQHVRGDAEIDWLHARLTHKGHNIPRDEVKAAVEGWQRKSRAERGKGVTIHL